MHELIYLKTLLLIRENDGCISIRKLNFLSRFHEIFHYQHGFSYLIDLCKEGYITFLDNDKNDITNFICTKDEYEFEDFRHSSFEQDYYIKLTNKLYKIQSLLGFSLNDTIAKYGNDFSTMVTPIWGKPDSKLNTDVFVIMPFQEVFNFLYKDHIKKVCNKCNLSCKRADDLYSSKPIMQDIWSLIYNSKIIIADCSTKNPNVMYELGIAHAIGKEVILITQDINDIPFDLRHLRHLHYKYAPHSINNFEDDLKNALYPYFK